MTVLETTRLRLAEFVTDDAAFILELVNEPSWLRFIGDKNIRTLDDARAYIANGPAASYRKFGYGLYRVEKKETGDPIGMCGLIKRDAFEYADVGFAFLPRHWGSGYAHESAAAVLKHGFSDFSLDRILAITDPDNRASIGVLEKLGMKFQTLVQLGDDAPKLKLFSIDKPVSDCRA